MPKTYKGFYYSAVIGEIMRQYLRKEIDEDMAQYLVDWANDRFGE